jgi:site-specific DNA recombinase
MGNIFGYIRQQIAAEERRKITERTMRNKIAKAERGKWVGSGATRYGYKRIGIGKDGKLIIDEHEASLVRKIFEWYQKGQSIRWVVRQVNAQGAVTKRGKKWQLSTVQEVLTSAEYVGYFHFCGITTHFPALKMIDKWVFDDVQIRLQSNKDLSRRNSKHDYLLSSVIRCANGHKMHGAADNKHQLFYYKCDGRLKCNCRYVRADVADALVWDWIVSTLDDDLIERGFQRMAQRRAEEIAPKCTRLAQVQKLLDSIDSKITRLVREMSDEDDDVLRAAVKAEVKNLSRQHEGLSKDKESLQAQIEQSEISQETRERIRQTVREVQSRLHNATFAQKRFIINKLEVQLVAREDDAGRWLDVSWGIGESPDSVLFVKKILSTAA